jgi:hypothetical protein
LLKVCIYSQDIGVNISTEQAVVDEIKNKKQLRKLVVLPYDLKVQEVFVENIKFGKSILLIINSLYIV